MTLEQGVYVLVVAAGLAFVIRGVLRTQSRIRPRRNWWKGIP
jgi:hypothetical protein